MNSSATSIRPQVAQRVANRSPIDTLRLVSPPGRRGHALERGVEVANVRRTEHDLREHPGQRRRFDGDRAALTVQRGASHPATTPGQVDDDVARAGVRLDPGRQQRRRRGRREPLEGGQRVPRFGARGGDTAGHGADDASPRPPAATAAGRQHRGRARSVATHMTTATIPIWTRPEASSRALSATCLRSATMPSRRRGPGRITESSIGAPGSSGSSRTWTRSRPHSTLAASPARPTRRSSRRPRIARWELIGLLAPLTEGDLDADPGGGEWTIRQTVAHIIASQHSYGVYTAWWRDQAIRTSDERLPFPPDGIDDPAWDEAIAADGSTDRDPEPAPSRARGRGRAAGRPLERGSGARRPLVWPSGDDRDPPGPLGLAHHRAHRAGRQDARVAGPPAIRGRTPGPARGCRLGPARGQRVAATPDASAIGVALDAAQNAAATAASVRAAGPA